MKKIVIFFFVSMVSSLCYGMNLLRPYDSLIQPLYTNAYRWQWSLWAATGVSDKGFNSSNDHTNVLRIWQVDQDALAMLNGFSDASAIGQKNAAVNADDDGTRGHFCVSGDLKNRFSGMVAARVFFKDIWSLSAYLPLYSMALHNVCWKDQTQHRTAEDERVHELLTDNFFAQVEELGCGLDLGDWDRTGVGDLTLLVQWFRDFEQAKPMLKKVRINWRAGVGIPTGLRQDTDKVLAFPFGYDGAFSLPFGFGLDLYFDFHLRAGFDVQLTHIFGNTRERRIKTSEGQTDLLFLEKMKVYKDWGLTQQFNLYGQVYKLFDAFSFLIGYQFIKHGKDSLALCPGSDFSAVVANTAESLREWTLHQIVLRADYEMGAHWDAPIIYPRFSFFAELPFNGKRSIATTNIGVTVALDF